jgi:hypothetical protein
MLFLSWIQYNMSSKGSSPNQPEGTREGRLAESDLQRWPQIHGQAEDQSQPDWASFLFLFFL